MNKSAIVTGGSSGIGLSIAEALQSQGYNVTITGRDVNELKKASDKLGVEYHQADMSDLPALKELSSRFNNGLDVLVNNAGYAMPKPVNEVSSEQFDAHFDINVRGPLFLTQYLLDALKLKQGCVVNISSIITSDNVPGFTFYAASKGALEASTRSLALELSPFNVRVNAICPGAIETPMFNKLGRSAEEVRQAKKAKEEKIPLRRFGTPKDIAKVVMAQIDSQYVTGSIWHADGGASL